MLQRCRINIDPAACIGKRTVANEIRGALRRTDVDHIKLTLDDFRICALFGDFEPSGLGSAVNLDKVMAKIEVNAVFVDIFHQRWHIGCTAEQHRAGVAKRHIHVF